MTKVKICGITNLEDAVVAVEAGADALGFNFYEKSARCVAPGAVADIVRKVKLIRSEVVAVGVFVNEQIDRACDIAVRSDIDAFQLHGDESHGYVEALRSSLGMPIIKAFRVDSYFEISRLNEYDVEAFLLDGFSPNERGGSGILTDRDVATSAVYRGSKI